MSQQIGEQFKEIRQDLEKYRGEASETQQRFEKLLQELQGLAQGLPQEIQSTSQAIQNLAQDARKHQSTVEGAQTEAVAHGKKLTGGFESSRERVTQARSPVDGSLAQFNDGIKKGHQDVQGALSVVQSGFQTALKQLGQTQTSVEQTQVQSSSSLQELQQHLGEFTLAFQQAHADTDARAVQLKTRVQESTDQHLPKEFIAFNGFVDSEHQVVVQTGVKQCEERASTSTQALETAAGQLFSEGAEVWDRAFQEVVAHCQDELPRIVQEGVQKKIQETGEDLGGELAISISVGIGGATVTGTVAEFLPALAAVNSVLKMAGY